MKLLQAVRDYSLVLVVIVLALSFGWVTAALYGAGS